MFRPMHIHADQATQTGSPEGNGREAEEAVSSCIHGGRKGQNRAMMDSSRLVVITLTCGVQSPTSDQP